MSHGPDRPVEVLSVRKNCPNPMGCACIGTCQEMMDVVSAADYWRVVGERDEARQSVPVPLVSWVRDIGWIHPPSSDFDGCTE